MICCCARVHENDTSATLVTFPNARIVFAVGSMLQNVRIPTLWDLLELILSSIPLHSTASVTGGAPGQLLMGGDSRVTLAISRRRRDALDTLDLSGSIRDMAT